MPLLSLIMNYVLNNGEVLTTFDILKFSMIASLRGHKQRK